MRRKVVKTSLLVIALMISITIPIIAVTAKKKEWEIDPIIIDESAVMGPTWADWEDEPWLKGSGTLEDPYMIKNVVIDAGGNFFCIMIMNSEAYFKIMHSTFSNTGPNNSPDGRNAALILVNTQNGVIFKNEIFDCGIATGQGSGIALIASSNNKLQKNLCHDNAGPGIYLQYSYNNVIRQNLCERNQWGIMIADGSNNNEVTKNDCYDNNEYGIFLYNGANNNLITKNDCKENFNSGIIVIQSHGNTLSDNDCSENGNGIFIMYSNGNDVINNVCNDNPGSGIYLQYSSNNVIRQNLCKGNQWGIMVEWWSSYNEITDNDCSNNIETGIHLFYYADYNKITNNDCKENLGSGITLSTSNGNILSINDCSNNGENGIFLVDWYDPMRIVNQTANNILYRNYIENNLNGIRFLEADKNDVFRNTIKDNNVGIFMEDQSAHNMIYQNNFIDNDVQALNEHAGLNNWHSIYILEGNYWSDYTGTDSDGDGIGDTPWPWADFDVYPFMEENGWEITTPLEDELLNAWFYPDFNRLGASRTVHNNKTTYLMVGMGHGFSERIQDIYRPPYTCRLWFYGEEFYFQGTISFFRYESIYGEPIWYHLFYLIIPPYTLLEAGLPPGWNEFQWELTFYSGGEQQTMHATSYFFLV